MIFQGISYLTRTKVEKATDALLFVLLADIEASPQNWQDFGGYPYGVIHSPSLDIKINTESTEVWTTGRASQIDGFSYYARQRAKRTFRKWYGRKDIRKISDALAAIEERMIQDAKEATTQD